MLDRLSSTFKKKKTRWHTQPRTHAPPWRCLYLRETKSWWCEEEEEEKGEGEKVSLKTHAAARGMGKNVKRTFNFRHRMFKFRQIMFNFEYRM